MVQIELRENDSGQRLDRFLRKYYRNAPLSMLYRMIRKDVKVNGKRCQEEYLLCSGDVLQVYLPETQEKALRTVKRQQQEKRQFHIAYEDQDLLIVEKPFGLLTHGNQKERKHTLANQVLGYLYARGEYDPGMASTFTPSPANRLDRNTTGLVLFGKTAAALRESNRLIRTKGEIGKYYRTIVAGKLEHPLYLQDAMEKDAARNRIRVVPGNTGTGRRMETVARPVCPGEKNGQEYTLLEVELVTGRTHQIRAHLASAGYPLIGDPKYGNRRINGEMKRQFHLTTQLLHACRMEFRAGTHRGLVVTAAPPKRFQQVSRALTGVAEHEAK